ncbi:MarR family winged helix-turn-helix transcriptional regulator [uncultured Nisaea sp.]|jgi:DNA-binding MarR family transcriptional regulator|uniref:MarR family winged helix-turn-helix transcriptional regulator n=1 Tax=uncultured Nisaea sp. TaxID=538215 RepID=UPI0030ED18D5|tara:strand:+ start:1883 stop:2404 length:522 start_codon:yes stop_codon:yes gene_type:complete
MSGVTTPDQNTADPSAIKNEYLEAIKLIERLHRQFLEVVKMELDRKGIEDINNIQALILFNIGSEELTVGELTNRGYYLGSNVSYNVRKMVENGYLAQERSAHDRRSIRVKLSDKGLELCGFVTEMFDRHASALGDSGGSPDRLNESSTVYRELERFWMGLLNFGIRGGMPPV